jgi:hypothetical protein
MVKFSFHGITSQHAGSGTQTVIFNKVLPMSPDQSVTHVPGLDLSIASRTTNV